MQKVIVDRKRSEELCNDDKVNLNVNKMLQGELFPQLCSDPIV